MNKASFKPTALFALIFLAFVIGGNCDAFNVTVTCQKCLIACQFSNCLRVAGPGYEHEICPTNSSCQLTSNTTYTVDKCLYDFSGKQCGSRICLAPIKKQGCASTIWGLNTCTQFFNYTQQCGACTVQNSSCAQCSFQKRNRNGVTTNVSEKCLGTSGCNGVINITTFVFQCTKDSNGVPCACCYNTTSTTATSPWPGNCSSSFYPTNFARFYNYALNRLQYNSTATSGDSHIHAILALLVLCILTLLQ